MSCKMWQLHVNHKHFETNKISDKRTNEHKSKTKNQQQQQQQQITKNSPESFPSPKNHNSAALPSEHFGWVF